MAKAKIRSYVFDSSPAADAWEVTDEFVADEDIVVLGFISSNIGRGLNGAAGLSRSGTVNVSVVRQDSDVLYYQEITGVMAAADNVLSHHTMFFPEDARPELSKDSRLYLWIESGATNIQHFIMFYRFK